jgi:hypothetical protein
MLRLVVLWKFTGFSEILTASIIRTMMEVHHPDDGGSTEL